MNKNVEKAVRKARKEMSKRAKKASKMIRKMGAEVIKTVEIVSTVKEDSNK